MSPSIRVKTKRRRIRFTPKLPAQNWHDRSELMTTLRDSSQDTSAMEPKRSKSMRKSLDERTSVRPQEHEAVEKSTEHTEFDNEAAHSILGQDQANRCIPNLFTTWPPIRDPLETESSILQDETIQECLPLLAGIEGSSSPVLGFNAHARTQTHTHDIPRLERAKHVKFLHHSFEELSTRYVGYDASRPWIIYWVLLGLCLLGEDVTQYRERFKLQTPISYLVDQTR